MYIGMDIYIYRVCIYIYIITFRVKVCIGLRVSMQGGGAVPLRGQYTKGPIVTL